MPAAATAMRRKTNRTATRAMVIRIIMRRTITRRMVTAAMITVPTITMTSISIPSIPAPPMLMTTSKPPPAGDRGGMTETEAAALYRLMTWLSPAFPVGAFSYSSGIEWGGEAGDIVDAASLRDWLSAMLADGPGFCDGVFLAHAHRAAASDDAGGLRDVAELASAFMPSRERHLETTSQGRAFIDIARSAWNCGD